LIHYSKIMVALHRYSTISFLLLLHPCYAFKANLPNRMEKAFNTINVSSKKQATLLSMSTIEDIEKKKEEKLVIDTVKATTEKMLKKETPTSTFGKPISDDMIEFNKATVGFIKTMLFDTLFSGRDYARFYALENIARMPYFSYLSVLHLYETLGMWRQKNYLKIHFAEEWNELHHLLIMEELGGNDQLFDRVVAQGVAIGYYWVVFFMYLFNPTLAYNLNEEVETHAYNTYDTFLKENEAKLKALPAPQVAKDYYRDGDLYMFDEFQTIVDCEDQEARRPVCDTLYDVFVNIRDDELEHCKTMKHLQAGKVLTTIHEPEDECEINYEHHDLMP